MMDEVGWGSKPHSHPLDTSEVAHACFTPPKTRIMANTIESLVPYMCTDIAM